LWRDNFALTDREKRTRKAAAAAVYSLTEQGSHLYYCSNLPVRHCGLPPCWWLHACLPASAREAQSSAAALGGARQGTGSGGQTHTAAAKRIRRRRGRTPRDAPGLRRNGRPMPAQAAAAGGCRLQARSGPHINVGCCEVGCATRTGQETGALFTPPRAVSRGGRPHPSATPRRASASAVRPDSGEFVCGEGWWWARSRNSSVLTRATALFSILIRFVFI